MRTPRVILIVSILLSIVAAADAVASEFDRYGLSPAAIIIAGGDMDTYRAVRARLRKIDAKGLIIDPPSTVFGYFPPGMDNDDFPGLDIEIVRSASDGYVGRLSSGDQASLRALFNDIGADRSTGQKIDLGPIDNPVLRVPRESIEMYRATAGLQAGGQSGSPSMITERGIDQNSEFMMGDVLINVVVAESGPGGSEDWTQDEKDALKADISLGLSQMMQATHWLELSFSVKYYWDVPVSMEPVEGGMDTDPVWTSEAMAYLAEMGHYDPMERDLFEDVHIFNNTKREYWGTDWVFTSFVADASVNECWVQGSGYAAYSYFGGPFDVLCYPACRFGTGLAFGHVFIHEMGHTFWALDEYASAGSPCTERSGYMNVINANSYHRDCGFGYECIMNNAELSEPLPVCPYTMGQIGVGDFNENSIPDLYERYPYVEILYMPGVSSDTTYDGTYLLGAVANNAAVPNQNQAQDPSYRIDYAPYLKKGWRQINDNILEPIDPIDSEWDESSENLSYILTEGLEPGDNYIYFIVENCVGLQAKDSLHVTYIGMTFYQVNTEAGDDFIDLSWLTADQVFGADFEIYRQDVTMGTEFELIDIVEGEFPTSTGSRRNYYTYRDADVETKHLYNYQLVSRINAIVDGEPKEYVHESEIFSEKSLIPVVEGILSPIVPNPFFISRHGSVEFTIKLPGEFDVMASSGARGMQAGSSAAAADDKIMLDVDIYNVNGQLVRHLYSLPLYGGKYKEMQWDGRNDSGQKVANGIYFLKVVAGGIEKVKKIVVLR